MRDCKYYHYVKADPNGSSNDGDGCLLSGGHCLEKCEHYQMSSYYIKDDVNKAIQTFVVFITKGWNTELAFECAYDSVYDIIDKESFLNRCQETIKNL